jgi:hypothetical protein
MLGKHIKHVHCARDATAEAANVPVLLPFDRIMIEHFLLSRFRRHVLSEKLDWVCSGCKQC